MLVEIYSKTPHKNYIEFAHITLVKYPKIYPS